MQVTAISTPRFPLWRWRITNFAGELIEESRESFKTLSEAVSAGTERMGAMHVIDRSEAARSPWTVRHESKRRAP